MAGDFIIHTKNLHERNQWLLTHAAQIAPYLQDGRDCIIFTFSRQKPVDRMTTRIGGLPYWSREQPWPVCKACGQPLIFLAQLDFRASQVRPTVHGDVLTFHGCSNCVSWSSDDPGGGPLTWQGAIRSEHLVTEADVPPVPEEFQVGPFYGQPWNAIDYPTPPEAFGGWIAGESSTYLQFTLQGTKIGGYPPPIQQFQIPADSRGRAMRFLGTIGSVQGHVVDQSDDLLNDRGDLLWGDMGCVYLWISTDATEPKMTWFIECY
jgi:hypothetical protein